MLPSPMQTLRPLLGLLLSLHLAAAADAALRVEPWPLPADTTPSAQPDLVPAADGDLLLAWVEKTPDADTSHRLRFARFGTDAWSAPRDIAHGSDWFVNWADIPHLLALRDGSLWAHWLRRNGTGTYDYGIALVHSRDGGATWSEPQRVEPDGAKLDYGFVSLWEQGEGDLGIAWLDARQKSADAGHDHHAQGGGAMTLRAARFGSDAIRSAEWPLDASTCDCCPTAAAATAQGAVIAYRGRRADEQRDIHVVRFDGKQWSPPVHVHDDGWRIAGCPVNGPGIAAHGEALALAWYTEGPGTPTVRIARSRDAGASFGPPTDVAQGADVVGRVALAADAERFWLLWLQAQDAGGQSLWLARFDADSMVEQDRLQVAALHGSGAATGLPKLQVREHEAFVVWTDAIDGAPQLRGARVRD